NPVSSQRGVCKLSVPRPSFVRVVFTRNREFESISLQRRVERTPVRDYGSGLAGLNTIAHAVCPASPSWLTVGSAAPRPQHHHRVTFESAAASAARCASIAAKALAAVCRGNRYRHGRSEDPEEDRRKAAVLLPLYAHVSRPL